MNALYVLVGGALGSLMRYYVGVWVTNAIGARSPGTFVVNIAGSFAIGAFLTMSVQRSWTNAAVLLIAVGFLGAFTTFSTFTWQTYELIDAGHLGRAFLNVGASLVVGMLAVWGGVMLGKAI